MTGYELLVALGVPAMFALAGVFGYLLVVRDTARFDKKRSGRAH